MLLITLGCPAPTRNSLRLPFNLSLGTTFEATHQDCADRCATTAGCVYWTHLDTENGPCHLSTAGAQSTEQRCVPFTRH